MVGAFTILSSPFTGEVLGSAERRGSGATRPPSAALRLAPPPQWGEDGMQ